MLPRPEDHLILADLNPDTLLPAGDPAAHRPTRMVIVTGAMLGGLVCMLLIMMLWMRYFSGTAVSSSAPPAGVQTGLTPPPDPTYTLTGPAAPPPGANTAPAGTATPGTAAGQPPTTVDPRRAAAEVLRRVLIAQQAYRTEKGRYATLAELEKHGVLDPGAAQGRPLALYGNAILREQPPTAITFQVTAALPDGITLVVDQNDGPPK
jgi:hypothetical protein